MLDEIPVVSHSVNELTTGFCAIKVSEIRKININAHFFHSVNSH